MSEETLREWDSYLEQAGTENVSVNVQTLRALIAEVLHTRSIVNEVYQAGVGMPGNRAAAAVEPLWGVRR